MSSSGFSHIVGNDLSKRYLSRMISHKMVGNSYLFAGRDGIGKSLFAEALAAELIGCDREKIHRGNHPDVRMFRPEGKVGMHSIDSMRHFNEQVFLSPHEAEWKVFILHEADRMLSYSANALLKTFEEPARDSIIILLTSSPQNILPTVLSRCRRLYFQPIDQGEIASFLIQRELDEDKAKKIASIADGSIAEALRLAEQETDKNRTLLLDFLAKSGYHSYLSIHQVAKQLEVNFETIKKTIEEEVRAELEKVKREDLPVLQRELIEKEISGLISIKYTSEIDRLLSTILFWFRDLHLLNVGGQLDLLTHADYLENAKACCHRKALPSLENIQKALIQTKLAVQRFVPLSNALESLFLTI